MAVQTTVLFDRFSILITLRYNKSEKGAELPTQLQCRTVKKTVARITDLIRPTRAKVGTDYFFLVFEDFIAEAKLKVAERMLYHFTFIIQLRYFQALQ